KVDARLRLHAKQLAYHQVDSGIGLAHAGLGAFDDCVEVSHDVAGARRARGVCGHARSVAMNHVVSDATHLEAPLASEQRLNHPRPYLARQQRQNLRATHWMTERGRLLME